MTVNPGGIGGAGGASGAEHIRSAFEGIKSANQAVLEVMRELEEFLDAQDVAIKQEREEALREEMSRLQGLIENAETGSLRGINPTTLTDFQNVVDEARMGGAGNSEVIQQAQQLIDDLRAQLGLLG